TGAHRWLAATAAGRCRATAGAAATPGAAARAAAAAGIAAGRQHPVAAARTAQRRAEAGGESMTLFRNVVLWLLLAVLGALLAQHLLQDPGYVLVRYRGVDYSTTLAMGIALLLALAAATALLWTL